MRRPISRMGGGSAQCLFLTTRTAVSGRWKRYLEEILKLEQLQFLVERETGRIIRDGKKRRRRKMWKQRIVHKVT